MNHCTLLISIFFLNQHLYQPVIFQITSLFYHPKSFLKQHTIQPTKLLKTSQNTSPETTVHALLAIRATVRGQTHTTIKKTHVPKNSSVANKTQELPNFGL